MKIALIYANPKKKLSARLTMLFTGSNCYHVAFMDEDSGWMWDMHKLMRKVIWSFRYPNSHVVLVDAPFKVTARELDAHLFVRLEEFCGARTWDEHLLALYGLRDYLSFALRPLYHLVGKSTRNYGGVVCSGLLRDIAVLYGDWRKLGTRTDPEPSPADWCRVLGAPLVLEIKA